MSGQRALRFLPTAAVAVAGVLFGHWLSYIAALPQSHARAALLAATGHGYWTEIVRVAAALGVAGLGALLLSHLRDTGSAQREERFSALILRLVAIQSVAFVSMEALERLVARAPVASLLQSRVLVLGLAFQVLTALLGALLLRWLHRAVEELVSILRRPALRPVAAEPRWNPAPPFRPRPAMAGASGLRGPPLR